MEKKSKMVYVVVKNYGDPVATFTTQAKLFGYIMGTSKNNLTKVLHQQIIKRILKNGQMYRKVVGKLYIEIWPTEADLLPVKNKALKKSVENAEKKKK